MIGNCVFQRPMVLEPIFRAICGDSAAFGSGSGGVRFRCPVFAKLLMILIFSRQCPELMIGEPQVFGSQGAIPPMSIQRLRYQAHFKF